MVSKQLKYKRKKSVLACTKTGKPQNGKLPLNFERPEMAGVGKGTGRGRVSQGITVENQLFPRHFSFSSVFFWRMVFQADPCAPSLLYTFQAPTPALYFLPPLTLL